MVRLRWLSGLPLIAATLIASPSNAQVHVNIYNDAGVDSRTVYEGQREARRILAKAGVVLTWTECDTEPCSSGEQYLQLRLYAAESELAFRVARNVHAFALPASPPQFGFFIGVFARQVDERARRERISRGKLLGHVIAHEIGHLLLGLGAHAKAGIMKFPWGNGEIDKLQVGSLLFLPNEAAILRSNVQARLLALR